MKFSAKARYGLKAVYVLAQNYGENKEPLSINVLAPQVNTTSAYLEKIMNCLKKADIVDSQMGVLGGYTLSYPPKDITVGKVLKTLEGDIFTSDCVKNNCTNNNCPNKDIFGTIYMKVNELLENITIQDVLDNRKELI